MLRERVFIGKFVWLIGLQALIVLAIAACADKSRDTAAAPPTSAPSITTLGPNATRFCIYGDTRDGHDAHRKVIALMVKQQPEFILQTGDLVHDGRNLGQWKIYDEITAPARAKAPFYIVRGNHDFGGTNFESRVTAPDMTGTKFWYSFNHANCHIIGLAIDEKTSYNESSDQYKWLVKDLESAVQSKPTHIFVFFHVSPYSIGSHGSDLDVRKTLCPLFTKYGVRAVFTGHDHIYYHTAREGVNYIVTGGGGAPLYECDEGKGAIPGDKFESVNHFLTCEINGGMASFTTYRANGTVLERFTLRAPAASVSPAAPTANTTAPDKAAGDAPPTAADQNTPKKKKKREE